MKHKQQRKTDSLVTMSMHAFHLIQNLQLGHSIGQHAASYYALDKTHTD